MSSFIKYGYDQIPKGISGFFPQKKDYFYKTTLKGRLKDLGDRAILEKTVGQYLKQDDWSFRADEKRWYKLVIPRIRSVEGDSADTLLSLFSDTFCHRSEKVQTRIEEDVLIPECQNSPLNVDFPEIPPKRVFNRECVFSVAHKRRDLDPFIRCDECNGSGMVKCERCGGTGKEQYVDGNFASGVERIRTGNCPECGGRGRVQCPKCLGEGKIAIYAPDYSIVKSVQETCYHNVDIRYWTPWGHPFKSMTGWYVPELEKGSWRDDNAEEACYDAVLEATRGNILIRNRNRLSKELDLTEELQEELKQSGLEDAYDINLKKKSHFSDDPTVLQEELHIVIPTRFIRTKIGDTDLYLFAYEDGSGNTQTALHNGGGSIGFPQYIALGFYFFLVRIGKLVLGLINK